MKRREAIALGLDRYNTGKPCKNGHISDRYVRGECIECSHIRSAEYARNNKGKRSEYNKAYYLENLDSMREKNLRYRQENTEAMRDACSRWKSNNRGRVNTLNNKRRAAKINATPAWITDEMLLEIEGFYKESSERLTPHHVDHIVPLQGESVCGLHVPWNLQVIPAEDNLKKGNSFGEPTSQD